MRNEYLLSERSPLTGGSKLSHPFTHHAPSPSAALDRLSRLDKIVTCVLVLIRNDWSLLSLSLFFFLIWKGYKKYPLVLCYHWALENMLTAARALEPCSDRWPWSGLMLCQSNSCACCEAHTSYITGATQMPHTIYEFRYTNSSLS